MFRNSRLDSMKTSLNEERIFSPVATESSALDNSRAELEAKLIEKTNLVAVLSQELDLAMEKLRFLGDDDGDYGMYPEKQISDSNQLLMHRMNFNAQKHEVQIGMLEKKLAIYEEKVAFMKANSMGIGMESQQPSDNVFVQKYKIMVEELQKERNDLIKEMGILQAKLRHAVGSIQEQQSRHENITDLSTKLDTLELEIIEKDGIISRLVHENQRLVDMIEDSCLMDKEFVQSSELPNFDYAMPNIKDDLISKFKSQVSRLNEIQLSRLTRVSESRLEELSHQLDEFLKQIET